MHPLGVQLYSAREQITADRDGVLRRLAQIGYGAVEPYDPLDDPAGFRAIADELGLAVPSTHGPVLSDRRDELAAAAATLGIEALIVPAVPAAEFADPAGVSRTAERLNEAAAWAAGHGLQLGYHNHYWEFTELPDGRPALDALADELAAEVFLEIDVYWAAVAGADVPDLLKRLGDRVRYLHVKDGPGTVEDPMTAVGAGTLPIAEILAAAPADARRVVELDRCATDVLDALADSYAFLAGSA
jgi:sugar phosphate isomerase/epimerase